MKSSSTAVAFVAAAVLLSGCGSAAAEPSTAPGWTAAGRADQRTGRVGAGIVAYRIALSKDWRYVPALLGLAELTEVSDPVEATALVRQAVSIAPQDQRARRLLREMLH